MENDISTLKLCETSIEEYFIPCDFRLVEMSLEAFTWPDKLKNSTMRCEKKLDDLKPKFLLIVKEIQAKIAKEFGILHFFLRIFLYFNPFSLRFLGI